MSIQKVQFVIDATDNASAQLEGIADSTEKLGVKSKASAAEMAIAGGAIATSIVAIGAKAMDVFGQFEKTMSGVKAVLTPTADEFEKLSDKARELGRDTQYSAQQSAEAMEMLAKNGITTSQILDGTIDSTLNLAAATGAGLSTAADIASSAMLSFGLEVKDLDQIVNSITGTTNVSKFGIEDYAQALAQGGGVAAAVGVNMKDFNATIAAISPLFQSGSDAGTSLKTMLLRLIPSSDKAYDAMQSLGIITEDGANKFFDASGKMKSMGEIAGVLQDSFGGLSDQQKNAALNTIFGTDAMRAAAAMANTGKEKFDELSAAIEKTDAAMIAIIRMDNWQGIMEKLNGSIDDLRISLGQMLAPALKVVAIAVTALAGGIAGLIQLFEKLPEPVQTFTKIIVGVTVAGVALAGAYAAASFAMAGFGAALSAVLVPAFPFIAAAAAIAGAAYILYKAWDSNFLGIKDATIAIFSEIGLRFNKVKDERYPIIKAAMDNIILAFSTARNFLKNMFTTEGNLLSNWWKGVWDGMVSIFQGVWDIISGVLQLVFQPFITALKAGLQIIGGDWQGAWETIKNHFVEIRNSVVQIATGVWEILKGLFSIAWEGIKLVLFGIRNQIPTQFQTILDSLKNKAITVWNNIKATVTTVFTSIVEWFSGAGKSAMEGGFGNMISGIAGIAKTVFNGILDTIEGFVNNSIDAINRLISALNAVNPLFQIPPIPRMNIGRLAHGGIAGQGYFGGSVVRGPGGIDKVPAMLSAGEVVLNAAQQSNLARNLEGGNGGGGITVVISNNEFFGSAEGFAEKIGDAIMSELKLHIAI